MATAPHNGVYVFVVCGAREHVDTLHASLPFLRARTRNRIVVVTDPSRNETPVLHTDVVAVQTPAELDNHQASIWLKTSLHRILPKGHRYVYLDTDVLAIGRQPDGIFDQYLPPIRFAADHCRLMQFSPYAVACACLRENAVLRDKVNRLVAEADPYSGSADERVIRGRRQVEGLFAQINAKPWQRLKTAARFMLSRGRFRLAEGVYFDKATQTWSVNGIPVMCRVNMGKIARGQGLRWNALKNELQTPDGKNIWKDTCAHLPQYIHQKFGVPVAAPDWQHWNGGVFLFSDESAGFMDTWHAYTLAIFADPKWKTRDQGTLVATVWKYGLQQHPVLPPTWNCIADYNNTSLALDAAGEKITLDGAHYLLPEFIHVYHRFGDTGWGIWNWVQKHQNPLAHAMD